MLSKSLTLASVVCALLPAALAATEVIAKPLPAGCSSYPLFNADTGTAGPWSVKVVDSENPDLESNGAFPVYSIAIVNRKPTIRWGAITILPKKGLAQQPFQCINDTLTANVATDLTAAGAPTNVAWTPLGISPYPYDAELMYKITDTSPVKLFEHWVGDVKQDGYFLGGYDNTTKWGFNYYPANQGSSGLDFYLIRLLGPNSADPTTHQPLGANETVGYISIRT